MNVKCSPQPWTWGQNEQNRFIKDATGNCILAYNRAMFSVDDANRIVACVNACENIPTQILEDAGAAIAKAKGKV